ncbi:hypothetical protein HBB16_17225 [Pseudonocardia sp. MCCB 268]|nr:hypothetical protein [Pseudonocardia cytotoxica]
MIRDGPPAYRRAARPRAEQPARPRRSSRTRWTSSSASATVQLAELRRCVHPLARRRLASRLSVRRKRAPRADVDLRRTAVDYPTGCRWTRHYRTRQPRSPGAELVLCGVSGRSPGSATSRCCWSGAAREQFSGAGVRVRQAHRQSHICSSPAPSLPGDAAGAARGAADRVRRALRLRQRVRRLPRAVRRRDHLEDVAAVLGDGRTNYRGLRGLRMMPRPRPAYALAELSPNGVGQREDSAAHRYGSAADARVPDGGQLADVVEPCCRSDAAGHGR